MKLILLQNSLNENWQVVGTSRNGSKASEPFQFKYYISNLQTSKFLNNLAVKCCCPMRI